MNEQDIKEPAWKARVAAAWVCFVFCAYLGTIIVERGERIRRIVSHWMD